MVQTLCEVTCVSNWHEMVTAHLKPGKMLTKLDDLLLSRTQNPDSIGSSSSSNNPLMLICDIILLSKSLTERDNLWKSAYDVMVSKGDLTSYLLEHLKSSGCTKDESAKILKVLTKCKMSVSNGSEEHLLKNNNLDALEEDSRLFQDWEIEKKCPEKQVAKIEEVVENVSKYVENQEVRGVSHILLCKDHNQFMTFIQIPTQRKNRTNSAF